MAKATLVRSALCLTTAKPRPSPTLFYYPGLQAQPFHDNEAFPWTQSFQENLDKIREEYEKLVKCQETSDYAIKESEHKLHSGEWDWFSYITKGVMHSPFQQQCPQTTQLLNQIPGFMTETPFAYSFFSRLKPQSSISAHSAPSNIRLRCHFPLYVPDDCGIRVGDEIRQWKEGECLIFDDSYDHEVWHDGKKDDRVVLLFDIWHPDMHVDEQKAVENMFGLAREKGWLND